ncbi:MAG: proprotein convertase P-domain-containing protein, partial [Myxococcota bacterium]
MRLAISLVLAVSTAACGGDDEPNVDVGDDLFGLDNASGYAGNYEESLAAPSEVKADQTLPTDFNLIDTQSPVKSQGSRGVCSVFGTVALMEHLYISDGTIADPDFSEQFLQWSAKFEVGSFPNSSGSNAASNLRALSNFGTVVEADWPYETSEWGTAEDEACTGDNRPTRCYTNGEPPASAMSAQRFRLPTGRWLSNSVESIKSHMFNTNTAVQAGGDFFRQAWGHGSTNLGRYAPYRALGYVLAPSREDVDDSSGDRRAGHSFLLVGWDDELEVQEVDAEGNLRVDDNGEPVVQRGFFLFKNSWGTGWAQDNPFGAGYGWIAYEYVEDHLSARVSGVPEVTLVESCGNGRDDDQNGLVDCADTACAEDRACIDPTGTYTSTTRVDIPDNDPTGAESTIVVDDGGQVTGVTVNVNIEHTYRGDLRVEVEKDGAIEVLTNGQGGGEDNFEGTFDLSAFDGIEASGTWILRVVDSAGADVGAILSWGLDIARCIGAACDDTPEVRSYTNDTLGVIPDNDTEGVSSTITATDAGPIGTLRVTVNISHEFPADLVVRLARNDTTVELVNSPNVFET